MCVCGGGRKGGRGVVCVGGGEEGREGGCVYVCVSMYMCRVI